MNNLRAWAMTGIVVAIVVFVVIHNRQAVPPSTEVKLNQSPVSQTQTLSQESQPSVEVKPDKSEPSPASQAAPLSLYLDGTVTLAGQVVNIQLADDLSKQLAGLEKRQSMAENEGMLFTLAKTYIPEFWMKDMLFPLDIIWIRDGRVVDISSHLGLEPGKSDNDLKRYLPKESVNMVLEINAGWAEKYNLAIGDEVKVSRK